MSAALSIYIEAPVDRVFDWFKDPRNWLTLNPAAARREEITHAHVTPEGLGTFHVWAMKPLPGVRFEIFGVFTDFVPNRQITCRWSTAFEGTETYSFDVEGSGTRVTLERDRRSFWRLRPVDALVDRFEGRESHQFLGRLKDFLESSTGATAPSG